MNFIKRASIDCNEFQPNSILIESYLTVFAFFSIKNATAPLYLFLFQGDETSLKTKLTNFIVVYYCIRARHFVMSNL